MAVPAVPPAASGGGMEARAGALPRVRPDRLRIFLRRGQWYGPSVEKIRRWLDLPEYRTR